MPIVQRYIWMQPTRYTQRCLHTQLLVSAGLLLYNQNSFLLFILSKHNFPHSNWQTKLVICYRFVSSVRRFSFGDIPVHVLYALLRYTCIFFNQRNLFLWQMSNRWYKSRELKYGYLNNEFITGIFRSRNTWMKQIKKTEKTSTVLRSYGCSVT